MRIHPECYPCFVRQTYNTLKLVTQDEILQTRVLKEVLKQLAHYEGEDPPPKVSQIVYETVSEITGVMDPYEKKKLECNRMAMELYPKLKEMVKRADDPLFMAVKMAIVGNIMDFGVGRSFEMESLDVVEKLDLVVSHYASLRKELSKASKVLYLGDNAGEVVFDRVLMEELDGVELTFAVRSGPIINDATVKDAVEAGINKIARIMDSGCWAPGVLLEETSPEFRKLFWEADVVISKGQGNFETLEDVSREIFFLLRAKCDVVAQLLGVNVGSTLLIRGGQPKRV